MTNGRGLWQLAISRIDRMHVHRARMRRALAALEYPKGSPRPWFAGGRVAQHIANLRVLRVSAGYVYRHTQPSSKWHRAAKAALAKAG